MDISVIKAELIALTAEAQFIRKLEHKQRKQISMLSIHEKLANNGYTSKQAERLARKAFVTSLKPSELKKIGFQSVAVGSATDPKKNAMQNMVYQLVGTISKPDPTWKEDHIEKLMNLHKMRTHVLRNEARSLQLAYAFFSGRSYESVEQYPYLDRFKNPNNWIGHNAPNWEMVEMIIHIYWPHCSDYQTWGDCQQAFRKWRPWAPQEIRREEFLLAHPLIKEKIKKLSQGTVAQLVRAVRS